MISVGERRRAAFVFAASRARRRATGGGFGFLLVPAGCRGLPAALELMLCDLT